MARKQLVRKRRKKSGQALSKEWSEKCVKSLVLLGFSVIKYAEFDFLRNSLFEEEERGTRYLVDGYPYTTPYGTRGKSEWLAWTHEAKLSIEVKCQQRSGSTDEKIPYVVARAHQCQHDGVLLLLEGFWWLDGRGKAAAEYAQNASSALWHQSRKHLYVCVGFDEFISTAKELWG